jgi:hypothetical protein
MSSEQVIKYLTAAKSAVTSVKAKLRYGAGNRPDDREATYQREHKNFERQAKKMVYGPGSVWLAGQLSRYIAELKVIAMRADDYFGKLPMAVGVERIRVLANQTIQYGAGNCSDQACVAFIELYDAGIRPLDIMYITKGQYGHAFVVIGKIENGSEDPSTWGSETVVCDPWNNDAYYLPPEQANSLLLIKMQCGCPFASSQIREN